MTEHVTLPPVAGRKLTKILPIRFSEEEVEAFRLEAIRRKMTLSGWVRSACATFLVCGKATVTVPALGGVLPSVVEKMLAEKHPGVVSEEEMGTLVEAPALVRRNTAAGKSSKAASPAAEVEAGETLQAAAPTFDDDFTL